MSAHEAPAAVCPSCAGRAARIGGIPAASTFCGRALEVPLPGGSLYGCRHCLLRFRHPQLEKDELDRLYRQTASDVWQYTAKHRRDWSIASAWVRERCRSGSVLDVGCFDGQFLSILDGAYERSGIEINPEAAVRARSRGVAIVGSDVADLARMGASFDAVVAMDVIEHVANPIELLTLLARAVRPGGIVIVSTGNTDALSWRFMGSRYWYCTLADHISFVNPAWCRRAAEVLDLRVERLQRFAHGSRGAAKWLAELGKNVLYRFAPAAAAALRARMGKQGGDALSGHASDTPPAWGSARDHIVVCFRKPEDARL